MIYKVGVYLSVLRPRSLRIERENGVYPVINDGNYRQDLFINEGAHTSFENCLFEACEKSEWVLEKGLSTLGKDAASIKTDLKSAKWKIMLAALLKQKTSAANVWITGELNMGTPDAVSRYVSEFRQSGGYRETEYEKLTTKVMSSFFAFFRSSGVCRPSSDANTIFSTCMYQLTNKTHSALTEKCLSPLFLRFSSANAVAEEINFKL